jgi:hypothetical protein
MAFGKYPQIDGAAAWGALPLVVRCKACVCRGPDFGQIPALTGETPERLDQWGLIATPRLCSHDANHGQIGKPFIPFVFSPTRFGMRGFVAAVAGKAAGIVWGQ